MTTIVVVRKKNKACIAADTQVTWGGSKIKESYLKDMSKIIQVGDNFLGVTGSSTHRHVLEHYFSRSENFSFKTPKEIFETWREFHKALKTEYFMNTGDDKETPYENSHMHVLLANPHGIFGVYALRSVDTYKKFWSFGSGTEYALGALHACYDQYDNVEDIARIAVEAAAEFDNGTSAPVTVRSVALVDE